MVLVWLAAGVMAVAPSVSTDVVRYGVDYGVNVPGESDRCPVHTLELASALPGIVAPDPKTRRNALKAFPFGRAEGVLPVLRLFKSAFRTRGRELIDALDRCMPCVGDEARWREAVCQATEVESDPIIKQMVALLWPIRAADSRDHCNEEPVIRAAKDAHPCVRALAVAEFGRCNCPKHVAKDDRVRFVLTALRDDDVGVRLQATIAIANQSALNTRAPEVVAQLVQALHLPETRGAAALALAELGENGESALADLVRFSADPDPDTRFDLINALGKCGGSSTAALKVLIAALDDLDWPVRCRAADYLIMSASTSIEQTLLESLTAVATTPTMTVRSAPCGTALSRPALRHGEPSTGLKRAMIAYVLGRREVVSRDVLAALAECAVDPDAMVRVEAVYSLGVRESIARPHTSVLVHALRDADSKVRTEAALALAYVGACSAESVQALAGAVRDDDTSVRAAVGFALAASGCEDSEALKCVQTLLHDSSTAVRLRLVAGAVYGKNRRAAELLRPLMDDRDLAVRDAMRRAIHGMDESTH